MAAAELVLKVDLEGDLRRFRVKVGAAGADTWRLILEAITVGFELADARELSLKYKDDEGDLCTLAMTTLSDCIAQSGSGPLKLFASRNAAWRATQPDAKPAVGQEQPTLPKAFSEPPGLHGEDAEDVRGCSAGADTGRSARKGAFAGCRGVGPWKLLLCLGGLRAQGKLSASMIASLMLQFLPILAQRAHRKQEKLNRVGEQHRELLLPTLHRILVHLDSIKDAVTVKQGLEAFAVGENTSNLGDCVASLLKILAAMESKVAVAQLLKGTSEELLDLLPRLFPENFQDVALPVPVHTGIRCAVCGVDPLQGPRFHNLSESIDICGECFIDYAFDASTKFECHLAADEAGFGFPAQEWGGGEGAEPWKGLAEAWISAGAEMADVWKQACKGWRQCKGKGKGKWKECMEFHGKGKGKRHGSKGHRHHHGSGADHWSSGPWGPSGPQPWLPPPAWFGGAFGPWGAGPHSEGSWMNGWDAASDCTTECASSAPVHSEQQLPDPSAPPHRTV